MIIWHQGVGPVVQSAPTARFGTQSVGVSLPVQVLVGPGNRTGAPSIDITRLVDIDSLRVEETGTLEAATLDMTVKDSTLLLRLMRGEWKVLVQHKGEPVFRGFIREPEPEVVVRWPLINCSAVDVGTLLDRCIITSDVTRKAGESDKARIQWLVDTFGQPLVAEGLTRWSGTQVLQSDMPKQTFPARLTLRQAIERVLGAASDSADYYLDYRPSLVTWDDDHPLTEAAPWDVDLAEVPGAVDFVDHFVGTESGSWGSNWTTVAGGASLSVSGDGGCITVSDSGAKAVRTTIAHTDIIATGYQVSLSALPSSGSVPFSFVIRAESLSNCYMCDVRISSAGVVTTQIRRYVGGTEAVLASVAAVDGFGTYVAGDRLHIEAVASGADIQLRVWRASGVRPFNATRAVTDTTHASGQYLMVMALPATFAGSSTLKFDRILYTATDDSALAPEDFRFRWDSAGRRSGYYVHGANAAGSGYVTDRSLGMRGPWSADLYGRSDDYLSAPDADTRTKRDRVAKATLRDTRNPVPSGSFTVTGEDRVVNGSGLRWRAGQLIYVTSEMHGLAGRGTDPGPWAGKDGGLSLQPFRITRTSTRWLAGGTQRAVEVEFGWRRIRPFSG